MSKGIPTSLTFEGNISERDIGALLAGGVAFLKGWPCMFVFVEKKRPDDVRVEVALRIKGLTKRQERLFTKALQGERQSMCVVSGGERGDV